MQQIDEQKLESDPAARFQYLSEFIGFTSADAAAIQSVAMYLGPMIPDLVDRTYQKLLSYDATARHFIPRQTGYFGPAPLDLTGISGSHPQIQFRKEHLAKYLSTILGRTCDTKLVPYLDMVGKIHTPQAGCKDIDVPLVQMNALMGYLSDMLIEVVLQLPLDQTSMAAAIRAFSKFLWIQNDFITRHYYHSTGSTNATQATR
ncbi:MAG: protoglobin family protein [Planctomycetota bacterium]